MHAPSRRNTRIGIAGLLWFIFCAGTTWLILADPDGFRDWSTYTWTDREIQIGAWCYFVCGLAGLILTITRLILPRFARRPRIGDGGTPLFVLDVVPQFEDFHALQSSASIRAANVNALVWLLGGVIVFVMIVHPQWRHEGRPLAASLIAFGGLFVVKVLNKFLFTRIIAATRWTSSLRWRLTARHSAPRRVEIYEDGILTYGNGFRARVPWYEISHAARWESTIGLAGRGDLILIPLHVLPAPHGLDQFLDLLDRKRVLPLPNEPLNTAARPGLRPYSTAEFRRPSTSHP